MHLPLPRVLLAPLFGLGLLATAACDAPSAPMRNELTAPAPAKGGAPQRGGIPDDSIKPKPVVVQRGGVPDDSVKPKPVVVQRGGIPDDSIKPKPVVVQRGGVPDDSVKPKPGASLPKPVR